LPDLGVQLFQLALADGLGRIAGPGERVRHPLDRLALPGRYHRVVDPVLGGELASVRSPRIASSATFALKSAL